MENHKTCVWSYRNLNWKMLETDSEQLELTICHWNWVGIRRAAGTMEATVVMEATAWSFVAMSGSADVMDIITRCGSQREEMHKGQRSKYNFKKL